MSTTLSVASTANKSFRFIAKMAKSGLIISPLIETTDEFKLLYERPGLLLSKRVKSFSIKICPQFKVMTTINEGIIS